MNRRDFFKIVTGYAAGVVAVLVPGKVNPLSTTSSSNSISSSASATASSDKSGSPAGWSADEWAEAHNNTVAEIEREFELWEIQKRLYPPMVIHEDGSRELFKYT